MLLYCTMIKLVSGKYKSEKGDGLILMNSPIYNVGLYRTT